MEAVAAPARLETLELGPGYSALGSRFVELRDPTPLSEPYPIAVSRGAAALIGLDEAEAERPEFLRLAAGNARFAAVPSFAAAYAGHQFGSFVPQLGDGRAITLAAVRTPDGSSNEWQVKGAGETAFSRFGDGRAVLRSTIREYLCSEAMAALGIPTTRALAIAGSDEPVFREMPETAAVLTRIAPSFVRFGTFEYFHYRGDLEHVKAVADYVIDRFFPEAAALAGAERYEAFFREVVVRTARLMARWQAVGFAHGVMNTDNMSILGLTLDYGPYGFLDAYDPGFICNHTDQLGRYAFDRQPAIGLWNCKALGVALSSLVDGAAAQRTLDAYEPAFRDASLAEFGAKFGLGRRSDGDPELFAAAFTALANGRVDHTIFFRALSRLGRVSTPSDDRVAALFADRGEWYTWQQRYRARLADDPRDDATRQTAMLAVNPAYVLRNYLAQEAIAAAQRRDYAPLKRLERVLADPFVEHEGDERYAEPPPDWAADISVSCSS